MLIGFGDRRRAWGWQLGQEMGVGFGDVFGKRDRI